MTDCIASGLPARSKIANFVTPFAGLLKGSPMFRAFAPFLLGLAVAFSFSAAASAQAATRNCHDEIARLENLITQAKAGGAPVTDMKEGSFATMHRQPSAASVLAADKDALARAQAALDTAKKAEAKHNEAACLMGMDDIAF
jgi:hypothetical protein